MANDEIEGYYMIRMEFKTTNNEVVLVGLVIGEVLETKKADLKANPQVVYQITREYLMKGKKRKRYLQQVYQLHDYFSYFQIYRIPQEDNWKVDRLC